MWLGASRWDILWVVLRPCGGGGGGWKGAEGWELSALSGSPLWAVSDPDSGSNEQKLGQMET